MNKQTNFHHLKKRILETYQKSYPYFQGDWKSFSSKDIRQLIELIEEQINERVSEKWIYTHLKPESNDKLPRKDMLDILSRFVGLSNWDEFVYTHSQIDSQPKLESIIKSKKKFKKKYWLLLLVPILGYIGYEILFKFPKKSLLIKNEFTKQPVKEEEIKVYEIKDSEKKPIEIVNSRIEIENETEQIIIESPYFEKKEINVADTQQEIYVKPEDYALVLKTFIESDLTNWENRKDKLEKILAEDLEVILLLKENLGAEFLNKKEFSEKLIIPTTEIKSYKILDLETNSDKKITFIRIQKT